MTRSLAKTRSTARRFGAFTAGALLALPLLLGCPSKPAMVVEDAGPPPPTPVASSATVTELVPLIDDAGADADAAETAPPKKWTGAPVTANQAKIKVCCNAMRAQAKQMGASPEAYQLGTMATQCDAFAAQVGPTGTAPELSQFREILKSIKLPSACAF